MRAARIILVLVVLIASLPAASAQGGNGQLRVWVETTSPTVEVPADGSPVDVPLTFRGIVSNSTCIEPVRYSVQIAVLPLPEVPAWANFTYGDNQTVTFEWEAGDFRILDPNHEVRSDEPRSLRLQWPLATPNATWVYKVSVAPPVQREGDCYYNIELRPQTPLAVRAYLEGGEAPDAFAPIVPIRDVTNTTVPSDTQAAAPGGDAPGVGPLAWASSVAVAFALSRRRR